MSKCLKYFLLLNSFNYLLFLPKISMQKIQYPEYESPKLPIFERGVWYWCYLCSTTLLS